MVPGETEILGQLKDAYRQAHDASATGTVLNLLFQGIFRAAKRVRTKGPIGRPVTSVVSLTRRLARRTFSDLAHKKVIVLGAGATAELAVKQFHSAGVRSITVLNRSAGRAEKVAGFYGADSGGMERLPGCIAAADIVVAAALLPSHAAPLVQPEMVIGANDRKEPHLHYFHRG